MSYDAHSQSNITDNSKMGEGATQVMIRDPVEILLGTSIDEEECTLQNIVVTYAVDNPYTIELKNGATYPHHLQRLMDIVEDAWTTILYPSTTDYEPTTNVTAALVCYNLGRLMRETINDDTFIDTIQDLDDELRTSLGGTLKTDSNGYAQDVAQLWFAVGNGLEDMFGEWSFTEWKPNDDAIAGLWMIFFYVLFHWGVQCCTYFSSDYLRGLGQYNTQGGAIEGRLIKLDPFNEKTWASRYLSSVNGTGDVFGLTAAMVDNAALKGVQVPLYDLVEPFIQKYFSRTRWLWRYMRWVDVSPIYTIMPPKVANKNMIALNTAYDDFEYMALFESSTDVDWDWWNTRLLNFAQKIQRFKFRGKNGGAFGKLKSKIKITNVFDLPEPGVGKGGIFWHQMSSVRIDVDVGGDDNFLMFKYLGAKEGSDLNYTPALAPDALHFYRDRDQYYWYQLIGLVDVDMFQFLMGVHTTRAYKRDGTTVAYILGTTADSGGNDTNRPTLYNFAFEPCGYVIWTVEKDEDEDYYLNPTPKSYSFEPLEDDSGYTFFGFAPCIYDWSDDAEVADSSYNYYYSVHELNLDRTDYLPMRSSDPYKKLKHVMYDLHNLDMYYIRKAMVDVYIGAPIKKNSNTVLESISQRRDGGGTGESHNTGEIKISAIPDKVDDDSNEKTDDETSDIKTSAVDGELKISALADEIQKMEKQLKLKKEQLKKDKEKEKKEASK